MEGLLVGKAADVADEPSSSTVRPILRASTSPALQEISMLTRLLFVALGVALTTATPWAQSDLDAFMGRVLARRDVNWKKLQQYVLEEREIFRVDGMTGSRMYGF